MKKITPLLFLLAIVSATTVKAQIEKKQLKKILELEIPQGGGSNGASVAWHSVLKKYYAAMAGNVSFPIGVYDVAGKLLSPDSLKALFDIRGLWYNPGSKTLQMNGYNTFGWGEYVLDRKGLPEEVTVLREGMNQPVEQSSGAFSAREEKVYFFNGYEGNIEVYDLAAGSYEESINLSLGRPENGKSGNNANVLEDYNSTTVIYTGLPKAELGLFNHEDNVIELYNINNGYVTRKLVLPADAPSPEMLNFAYCNGIYWLFDKSTRLWKGYK